MREGAAPSRLRLCLRPKGASYDSLGQRPRTVSGDDREGVWQTPSDPWGASVSANSAGGHGYHVVWTRDEYEMASALLAAGFAYYALGMAPLAGA